MERSLFLPIGLSIALGLIAFAIAWLPRKRSPQPHPAGTPVIPRRGEALWLAPLLIAGVVFGTYPLINSTSVWTFPPTETSGWIPWVALAAAILGAIESLTGATSMLRWLNRTALCAGIGYLILKVYIVDSNPASSQLLVREAIVWIEGFAAITLLAWGSLESITDRTRGASSPLVIMIWATAVCVGAVVTGSVTIGTSAAVIAAVSGPAWFISLFKRDLTLARGGAAVPAIVLCAVLLICVRASEMPLHTAILLALVPLFARLADEPGFVESTGPRRTIIRAVLASIPAIIAIVPVANEYIAAQAANEYTPDELAR